MTDIEFVSHPAADYFPMMSTIDFDRLKDDIRENGQVEPILVFGNQIIDGRNRYRACTALGVEPRVASYGGDPERITSYIISTNLHRGSLTDGQKAVIGAKIKPFYETILKVKSNASDMAAKAVNLPTRNVSSVIKILEKGIPEVVAQLESGKITVEDAVAISGLEQDQQGKVFKLVNEFVAEQETVIQTELEVVAKQEVDKVAEKISTIQDSGTVMLDELTKSLEVEVEQAASDDQRAQLEARKSQVVTEAQEKVDKKISVIKEKTDESIKAKAHKVFAKIQDLQKKKTKRIKGAVKEVKEVDAPAAEFIVYVEWGYRNGELNMAVKNSEVVEAGEEFYKVKCVGGKQVPRFAVLEVVAEKAFAEELCAKTLALGEQHKDANEEAYLSMEQQFLAEFKSMAASVIA